MKPQNIFIEFLYTSQYSPISGTQRSYNSKIFDFGSSTVTTNLRADINKFKFSGTIRYAAPEILMGKMPTVKCDIYSLGIVMWQMKYNKIPYWYISSNEVVAYQVVNNCMRPTSYLKVNNLTIILVYYYIKFNNPSSKL